MTAAIIVVVLSLTLRGTGRTRALVVGLGLAFALGVGASRVYLGDHYPTDILGSYLTVTAAVLLISAAADLTGVRRHAARLLRTPGIAPHPVAIPLARARPGDQAARQPRPAPKRPARPQQPGRPDPSQLTAASQPPSGGTR